MRKSGWSDLDRLIIFLVYALGSAAVSVRFFARAAPAFEAEWFEFYFVGLVFLVFGALVALEARLRKSRRPEGGSDPVEWKLWLAVFASISVYQLILLPARSISIDEAFQIHTALTEWPVAAGADQHQPPLEFAIMLLLMKIFGISETTVRLSAVFFGATAAATLALLVRRLAGGILLPLLATLVYALHCIVTQYGHEGRPISIGLAGELLVLACCVRALRAPGVRSPRDWLYGFAAALFALLVLGLQPPFLLLAFCFVGPVWLSSQWVAAVVAFLPIQLVIFEHSPPRFDKATGFSIGNLLRQYRWESFADFGQLYFLPILVPVLAGLAALWFFKPQTKEARRGLKEGGLFLACAAVFLLTLVPFFRAYVDWTLTRYYVIFVWPLLVLGCFALVAPLGNRGAAVLLAAFALNIPGWYAFRPQNAPPVFFRDNRGAYESVLRRFPEKRVAIFNLCLENASDRCPETLEAAPVYLHGSRLDYPRESTSDWFPHFFSSVEEPEALAIVLQETRGLYEFAGAPEELLGSIRQRFPKVTIEPYLGMTLLMFDPGEASARSRALELVELLAQYQTARGRSVLSLIPPLVAGNLAEGNRARAMAYAKVFKEHMPPGSYGSHGIYVPTFRKYLADSGLL